MVSPLLSSRARPAIGKANVPSLFAMAFAAMPSLAPSLPGFDVDFCRATSIFYISQKSEVRSAPLRGPLHGVSDG